MLIFKAYGFELLMLEGLNRLETPKMRILMDEEEITTCLLQKGEFVVKTEEESSSNTFISFPSQLLHPLFPTSYSCQQRDCTLDLSSFLTLHLPNISLFSPSSSVSLFLFMFKLYFNKYSIFIILAMSLIHYQDTYYYQLILLLFFRVTMRRAFPEAYIIIISSS